MTEQRTELALRRPLEPEAVPLPAAPDRSRADGNVVVDLTTGEPHVAIPELFRITSQAALIHAPRWQLAVKRAVDIFGSVLGFLVLSPLLIIVAIAVKASSPGPVLFGQLRIARDGDRFRFYKFRSMRNGAETERDGLLNHNECDGPVFKIKDDPRMTPVGRFLRRTSIDELPQLWNVLRGDMSLVGPRPPIPSEVVEYSEWESQRLLAKPGITCIWQVSGRSELDFETWVRMDIRYIERWSLWLDVKLLLRTIPAVLSGKGAY